MPTAQLLSTPTDTPARLAARIRDARERSALPFSEVADRAGLTLEELRAAENEGRISTFRLERLADATGRSIEYFFAAADPEPVGALLCAEDGTGPSTRAAIDWFEQFIQRYEFVASLSE